MRSIALILLVGLGVSAAGCGTGGKSPGVAALGTTSTPSTHQATPPGGSLSTGAGGKGAQGMHIFMRGSLKYSQCMRAHGVGNFPDPNSSGQIGIDSSSGIDPASPIFQSARKACAKDLPNGGKPTPQELAKAKQEALALSRCMRAHGVKDFPDPDFSGGGAKISLGGGGDLDQNNPTFKKAQQACRFGAFKP